MVSKFQMNCLIVGCCMLLFASATGCQSRNNNLKLTEPVSIAGEIFNLEVAADSYSRTRGLMERTQIDEYGGMLFIFGNEQVQQFWMGYCLVDIDVIFLDSSGVVTATHEMKCERLIGDDESEIRYRARLADYDSVLPAQFVIELRGGWLRQLMVKRGDMIELDLRRLKRLAH